MAIHMVERIEVPEKVLVARPVGSHRDRAKLGARSDCVSSREPRLPSAAHAAEHNKAAGPQRNVIDTQHIVANHEGWEVLTESLQQLTEGAGRRVNSLHGPSS